MQNTPTATPLVAKIADRLITAIATGEFLPGSRLPAERDLAVLLGVGRTSVRAALLVLHDCGLIETSRGRTGGSYIRTQWAPGSSAAVVRSLQLRWPDIEDRTEAMSRIHGSVARAAAERRDDHDVRELERWLAAYRAAPSQRLRQEADARLHVAIADAAKNSTLKEVQLSVDRTVTIGAPAHIWGDPEYSPHITDRATEHNERLVAAIAEGRPDDADAVAREHGQIAYELLEAAWRRAEELECAAGKCA